MGHCARRSLPSALSSREPALSRPLTCRWPAGWVLRARVWRAKPSWPWHRWQTLHAASPSAVPYFCGRRARVALPGWRLPKWALPCQLCAPPWLALLRSSSRTGSLQNSTHRRLLPPLLLLLLLLVLATRPEAATPEARLQIPPRRATPPTQQGTLVPPPPPVPPHPALPRCAAEQAGRGGVPWLLPGPPMMPSTQTTSWLLPSPRAPPQTSLPLRAPCWRAAPACCSQGPPWQ